jgi:hypothetical protein
MKKLSKRQSEAIRKMANGKQVSADSIGCRKDTMESLVRRGLVKKIVQHCYKRYWSYNMNYRFVLIPCIFDIEGLLPE